MHSVVNAVQITFIILFLDGGVCLDTKSQHSSDHIDSHSRFTVGDAAGQVPPGTPAIQITFVILFLDIGANSLNEPQILSVESDVRNAITAYVTPTVVGISINGSTPAAAPAPSGPPQVQALNHKP